MASQPQSHVRPTTNVGVLGNLPAVSMLRLEVREPTSTCWHSHPRCQLIYAASGLVQVSVATTTWVISARQAFLVPANVPHLTFCLAEISFCSAYIDVGLFDPAKVRMLKVSSLLDASLQALADEPDHYDRDGRGGFLANLIVDEIKRAPDAQLPLPMPRDSRLQKVCQALLEKPSLGLDIDDWSDSVGLSRRTFTRRFRAETQLSFAEWRRRLRML